MEIAHLSNLTIALTQKVAKISAVTVAVEEG